MAKVSEAYEPWWDLLILLVHEKLHLGLQSRYRDEPVNFQGVSPPKRVCSSSEGLIASRKDEPHGDRTWASHQKQPERAGFWG